MTDQPVPYVFKPLRFLAVFLGLTIGFPVVLAAIHYLFGVDLDSSATGIIPIMIASMTEGQYFAKAELRRPEGSEAWRIAGRMLALAVLTNCVLGAVFFVVQGDALMAIINQIGATSLLVIVAVLLVVYFLLARLFFGLGARGVIKTLKKQAHKTEG